MKISVYELVMETTRRCNMRCPHCLRGEPENKTMSKRHMIDFLLQVDYISTITFTGGEPTLPSGINVMYDFMDVCNNLGVEVGSFYIVSNAKVWRPELPDLVERLYNFCTENEVSLVDISTDRFHDPIQDKRMQFKIRLEDALSFNYGIEELVGMRRDVDYSSVITEGRGYNVGCRPYVGCELRIEEYNDGCINISEGELYLNCNGNVIKGCDWSYESQELPQNIICAASGNLEEAIKKHATEYEYA
jgi:hypothetical protein